MFIYFELGFGRRPMKICTDSNSVTTLNLSFELRASFGMAKVKRSGNIGPRRNCGRSVVSVREDRECNFEGETPLKIIT